MKIKLVPKLTKLCHVSVVASLLLWITTGSMQVQAADKYIPTGKFDSIALLAPPPTPGTEQNADLSAARSVFKSKSPTDEDRAMKHAKLTIFNFAPVLGSSFQPGKFPKAEKFFEDLKQEIKEEIFTPKDHWQRIRPYDVDPALNLGPTESSFSYPSGHSTQGMLAALILAEMFPEKKDALLKIGREIGWDRVVIGKHFPTDVYAGRVLAQSFARELLNVPAFKRDLGEVKEELKAGLR